VRGSLGFFAPAESKEDGPPSHFLIFANYSDTWYFLRLRLAPHPAFGTPLPNGRGAGGEGFRRYILQSSIRDATLAPAQHSDPD
jgi:hypothetical protein